MRLKRRYLFGVVRHQAYCLDSEVLEYQSRQLEDTAICFVAEFEIRFDRVPSLILQLIGLKLSHQANTTSLLLLVEHHTSACVSNRSQG